MSYIGAYVVQYRAEGDTPWHWSVFFERNPDLEEGAICDIQGDIHQYTFRWKGKVSLKRSKLYAGRVAIGSVLNTDKRLGDIEKVVKGIPIVQGNPSWNCQTWAKSAVQAIQNKGYLELNKPPDNLTRYLTGAEIEEALEKQK